jgi:hypothetical protein
MEFEDLVVSELSELLNPLVVSCSEFCLLSTVYCLLSSVLCALEP